MFFSTYSQIITIIFLTLYYYQKFIYYKYYYFICFLIIQIQLIFIHTYVIFAVIIAGTLPLVLFYANKRTYWTTIAVTFVGWVFSFLIVALIPFDVYISINKDCLGFEGELYWYWTVLYWTCYLMTWTVLPLMCSYLDNGYFLTREKIYYAFKYNICFYLVVGIVGIILVISIFAMGLGFLNFSSWKALTAFLVSVGNTWGLLQIVFFLAHGLIEVPTEFFKNFRYNHKLTEITCRISRIEDEYRIARENVMFLSQKAREMVSSISENLYPYIGQILEEVKDFEGENSKYSESEYKKKYAHITTISYDLLVSLNYDIQASVSEFRRVECIFNKNVYEALYLQDVAFSAKSVSERKEQDSGFRKLVSCFYVKIYPYLNLLLGILALLLSLLIVVSECLLSSSAYGTKIFHFFKGLISGSYFNTIFWTLLILGYLAICTFYGIFNFKLSGFYGLYPYHHTDPSCLVSSALYLAKLAAPLCLNFLMLIHFEENHLNTYFDAVAGRGASWKFVSSFLEYFPCLILILCLLYFFDIFSKCMKWLGLDEYTYYNFFDKDKFEEGEQILEIERKRIIIERERNKASTTIRTTPASSELKLIDDYYGV